MSVTPLSFQDFIGTTADEQRWQIFNASIPYSNTGTLLNQGSAGFTTTGGTLAAASRRYLLIQNTGTTNPLYVTTDGTTPSATNGFTLATNGGGIVFDGSFVPSGTITLASTATNFSILWA